MIRRSLHGVRADPLDDPNIGPRLPGLLHDAGFEYVQMKAVHHVALEGGNEILSCVTLENISEAILWDPLITDEALNDTI